MIALAFMDFELMRIMLATAFQAGADYERANPTRTRADLVAVTEGRIADIIETIRRRLDEAPPRYYLRLIARDLAAGYRAARNRP